MVDSVACPGRRCTVGRGLVGEFLRRRTQPSVPAVVTGAAALLDIQGNTIYLADEHPEIGVVSPTTLGRTPVSLVLEVPDADAAVEQAVTAGATVERPVTDNPGGRRAGWIVDPSGHRWNLSGPSTQTTALPDRVGPYEVTHGG
jgi:PhnB protein